MRRSEEDEGAAEDGGGRVERDLDRVPLLVDPRTGEEISRSGARKRKRAEDRARRKAKTRRRRRCEACGVGPRRRKLPNGLRVCQSCWDARLETPSRRAEPAAGRGPPPEREEDGPEEADPDARRGIRGGR